MMTNACLFLGRLLMGIFFILSGLWHIFYWDLAVAKTAATGIAYPEAILGTATFLLLAGGISLLLGYKIRVGISLLLIEIILTAILFNPFWSAPANEMLLAMLHFFQRMALCGGLLILFNTGSGNISLDKA